MTSQPRTCASCLQPLRVCHEPVDNRFPEAAREAYARAGYGSAPTCAEGQLRDMQRIGWCWDRARQHPEWRGTPPRAGSRQREAV